MYFSQVRVDPSNPDVVYVAGVPMAQSLDGGKTFATLDDAGGHHPPAHVDQHAIWIDPTNSKHLMIGNDGGLDVSWDRGNTWDFINTMATGLAYWVTADMRHPYYVYVGLQDNGSWGGPSATRSRNGILNSDWFGIGGGDGFQTAVDPTDYHVVYTESQNGIANRYDLRTGQSRASGPTPVGRRRRPALAASTAGGRRSGGGRAATVEWVREANVLNATAGDQYRFNWNYADPALPAQPEHRVDGSETDCSSRTTAARRGWRARTSPSRSTVARWR